MTQSRRPDVWLLSHGRTLSNLLCKMLSQQQGWESYEYHFHQAFLHLTVKHIDTPLAELSEEDREEFFGMLRQGYERLQAEQAAAREKGVSLFIKNHAFQIAEPSYLCQTWWGGDAGPALRFTNPDEPHTNPTMLPDSMLLSFIPIILIRHPALIAESFYRTDSRVAPVDLSKKYAVLQTDLQHSRRIYDWYLSKMPKDNTPNNTEGPFAPVVIDADDILEDNGTIEKLCKMCNFDPAQVCYQWEKHTAKADGPYAAMHESYMQGLWNSTGVDKSKSSKGITIEGKYKAWTDEFGSEVADHLKRLTDRAMEDYTYLKSQKI